MFIVLISLVVLGLLLGMWVLRNRSGLASAQAQGEEAFRHTYGSLQPRPDFGTDSRYGLPHFTITFASRELRDSAAEMGVNAQFVESIGTICSSFGTRANPFRPDRAVWFTYVGHAEELIAKHGL